MNRDQVLAALAEIDVEVAWDADQSTSPLSWDWTRMAPFVDSKGTLRARVLGDALDIRTGYSDETRGSPASSVEIEFDNSDGAWTPGNPLSPWYPNVEEGTPLRVVMPASGSYLLTDGDDGNLASTPDHASLDITGDIDLRYEGDIDWWRGSPVTGANGSGLVGKFRTAGDQRSYSFWIASGKMVLSWSTAGTAATEAGAVSAAVVPWAKGRHAVRATLDVNNGAGGRTVRFYTADSLAGPWTLLEEQISAGVTSIFSSTVPLEVGADSPTDPATGRTFAVEVYAGLTGTDLRAAPNFEAQAPGTTSFTDSAGRVWTVQGDAEIADRHVLFSGQVDEIKPDWIYDEPLEARATVVASGELRRLTQGDPPLDSALLRAETHPDVIGDVIGLWPCEDGQGATSFASALPGGTPMSFSPAESVNLASDDTLPASKPLPTVTGGEGFAYSAPVPARSGLTDYMLTSLWRVPTLATTGAQEILALFSTGTVKKWSLLLDDATITLTGRDGTGATVFTSGAGGATGWDDWVQVTVRILQDGANVDWELAWNTLGGSVFGGAGTLAGLIGRPTKIGGFFLSPTDGLSLGHLSVTTGVGAGWLGWSDGANNAWVGEPAGQRFERLCREQGVRVRIEGDPSNTTPMGPQPYDIGFLDLLDECVAADMGLQGDQLPDWPGLTYRTRASLYNQTPVVLDHAARAIVPPYQPVRDDQRRRTDVTVRRPDGGIGRHAIPAKAVYDESVELNVASDGQLPDLAAWKVHLGTAPGLRYPSAATDLVIAPQNAEAVRAIGQGDLVRLDNLPAGHPESSVGLIVEGVNPSVSGEGWTVELTSSPADRYAAGVIEDAESGRPDTEGCVLTAPVDADDTSWSFNTTIGPSWIDSAGFPSMFPFDWMVSGERVRVTAITGTGAAQTATVIRAVNGVSKSHPAGAAVALADPMRALL